MNEHESLQKVADAMRAAQGGPWMAAVWRAERGRVELVRRVTSDFQTGDFGLAVLLLAADLREEKDKVEGASPSVPSPLRVADFIKRYEGVSKEALKRNTELVVEAAREKTRETTDQEARIVDSFERPGFSVMPEEDQNHAEPPPDDPPA